MVEVAPQKDGVKTPTIHIIQTQLILATQKAKEGINNCVCAIPKLKKWKNGFCVIQDPKNACNFELKLRITLQFFRMTTKIFINLPVKDLNRSRVLYKAWVFKLSSVQR